jgi:DNA invertase Pin-like site-specific DNA recombinase
MPIAYSYIRFSSKQQADGDSIRRQTEAATQWCARNKVPLDESLTIRDYATSAFTGKHRKVAAASTGSSSATGLGSFLAAINSGRVRPGSFLLVENLDRLTRESIMPAMHFFTGILVAGIKIVQLSPTEQVFDEKTADMGTVMLALVELSRGNSESKLKSERVGKAWAQKKKEAREQKKIATRMTPGWITVDEDKLVLDPAKAATVRRIFALSLAGYGTGQIAKVLNKERIPLLGRQTFKGRRLIWSVNVIYSILRNRAVFGDYQPCVGSRGPERKPIGEPIPDYYPAAIKREMFEAVRAVMTERATNRGGERSQHITLFAGLVKDARSGGSLTPRYYADGRKPVWVPVEARTNRDAPWMTYQIEPLERAVRDQLAEIKASDLVPDEGGAAQQVATLSNELHDVRHSIKSWSAKMHLKDIEDIVTEKLLQFRRREQDLTRQLCEAQALADCPVSEALGQAQAAAANLDDDDSRLRYRAALRRVVQSIYILVLPSTPYAERFAAVQVNFKGSTAVRHYLVSYKVNKRADGTATTTYAVKSFKDASVAGKHDLRKPADVAQLERAIVKALTRPPAAKAG